MSDYLLIENPGTVGTDLLTIVGASTSRGNTNAIGQFGSGQKYSFALLLRKGIDVTFYLSNDGYAVEVDERMTKDVTGKECKIEEVVLRGVTGSKRKRRPLGFDKGFGSVDWKEETMAVREIVCNAIDACIVQKLNPSDVRIEMVDANQIRAKAGYTRFYVQLNSNIREYYKLLKANFLMLKQSYDPKAVVIPKQTRDQVTIYRKGVAVGHIQYRSMFDYNINDIEINECRTVSDYSATYNAARALKSYASVSQATEVLRAVLDDEDWFETREMDLDDMTFRDYEKDDDAWKRWNTAANIVISEGEAICLTDHTNEALRRKGVKPIQLPPLAYKLFSRLDVPSDVKYLTDFEVKGRTKIEFTPEQVDVATQVWEILEKLGVTIDKDMPPLEGYHDVMNSGSITLGYYDSTRGVVGISKDVLDTGLGFNFVVTLIEEYAHYVTGSSDCTRDLQDWAFRVAAKLMADR